MSYQQHPTYEWIVACDVCSSIGAVFDRDWRAMQHDAQGEPLHLCRACRKTALWCATHQRYHRAEDNHRCACVVCGGLFTSAVQQRLAHCPSCRRALPPAAAPAPAQRPPSLRSLFLHLGLLH